MSAFGLEIEQRRISEPGVITAGIQTSLNTQLRSLVAERTETVNPFSLWVDQDGIKATGFEHRGDLNKTFELSVREAADQQRAERFSLENEGYELAKEQFFKLPLYSTVVLMSPPPSVPIEGYPGYNLAYFYHILPGESPKKRTIKAMSFVNRFSDEEQAEILNRLQGEETVAPTESSILKSPVGIKGEDASTDSFKKIWDIIDEVYGREERDFTIMPFGIAEQLLLRGEELWENKNKTLSVVIEEVSRMIAAGSTADQIKDKWKIMLNLADKRLLHKDHTDEDGVLEQGVIFDRYSYLAEQEVRIAATSCGASGGIDTNPMAQLSNPLGRFSNSANAVNTKTYTVEEAKNDPELCRCKEAKESHFHCPSCAEAIVVGEGISECPSCGTGKVCVEL